MPEQQVKRRRVTRACDECRKKKVRCDGQQPCIHCTVYAYECTYNQPSKRTNNVLIPNISTSKHSIVRRSNNNISKNIINASDNLDNNIINDTNMTDINSNNILSPSSSNIPNMNVISPNPSTLSLNSAFVSSKNFKLQNEITKYQQLLNIILPDLPPISSIDIPTFAQIVQNFRGHSSNYLEDAVKEYYIISNDSISPPSALSPRIATPEGYSKSTNVSSVNSMESVSESVDGAMTNKSTIGREIKIILPPKGIALQFVENTWKYCCVLLRFYHRPSFIEQLNELYDTDPNNYTQRQIHFLPLCYSTIAVGALFSKSLSTDDNSTEKDSNVEDESQKKFLQDEGYKYFIAARKLIDITNIRDLSSIQTVVMLFIFLQCSARLSTCYSYIGVAMRSMVREGYHRLSPSNSDMNSIEIEVRKRLFYTIYKLDIYVNAMLGLPRSISKDDFDQVLPVELSDENITVDGYFPENQHGILSSVAISNHHAKLLMILNDIVGDLYPIKKTNNIISHETVTRLELKLKEWVHQLPQELKPNASSLEPRYERANKLLHLSFLHVQIILYRPFIHYISHKFASSAPDPLSLQRARNSINVSRIVVRLAQDMMNKKLISGSYWYANYTIFYSVAGLLFYTHEAEPSDKESAREYYDIIKDAEIGRNLLLNLKDSSMAANRTYNILNKLFEKLNNRTIQLLYPWEHKSEISGKNSNNNTPSNDIYEGILENEELNSEKEVLRSSMNIPSNEKDDNAKSDLNVETFIKTLPASETYQQNSNNNIIDDSNQMNSMFNFNPDANELLMQSVTNDDFKNLQNIKTPETSAPISSTFNTPGSDLRVKNENTDDIGVLNVFDQLDAQLFGKYVPENK